MARVMDNLVDECDGPIGSNPATWGFPRVGDKARNYRREQPPTSMNRAYQMRRCRTWIHKRYKPP